MSGLPDKRELARRNRAFLKQVTAASLARHASRLVLNAMISRADMYSDPPIVTLTKTDLIVDTCLCLKSVKSALTNLRREGVIIPTQGLEGGRNRAVTYRFRVVGEGGASPAQDAGQGGQTEARWATALTTLRAENRDRAAAWYVPLRAVQITDAEAHLEAPTRFLASRVSETALNEPLRAALGVRRVTITSTDS
ncbi:hypothetical protein [Rhodophyticola sp.]|jgi:hypothetical protein|uniref:hypothetical protein n=1 Tax=Rhodophyticola sp. TaxID=2680032 RepID=UPI003D26AFA7